MNTTHNRIAMMQALMSAFDEKQAILEKINEQARNQADAVRRLVEDQVDINRTNKLSRTVNLNLTPCAFKYSNVIKFRG
jgi:hypothetical protein